MKSHPQTKIRTTRYRLALILILLITSLGAIQAAPTQPITESHREIAPGEQGEMITPEGLSSDEWTSMQELIRQAQYQFAWQVVDGEWSFRAPNPANDFSLSLAADGLHAVHPSTGGMPYRTQTKAVIPIVNIPQFQPGIGLPVKVHPTNPTQVVMDIYQ